MSKTPKRGRPKSKEKMEQITIKLPPKMLEELKELSEKSYNPISFHIRNALALYLESYKKQNFK